MQKHTGFVFHDRYLQHNSGLELINKVPYPYAEPEPSLSGPQILARTKHLLDLTHIIDKLHQISPIYADETQLRMVHDETYIQHVIEIANSGGGDAGLNAPLGMDGYEIACLAVGGAIKAAEAVITETVNNCYALIRPPGHHANQKIGMGYCVFNNIAVAARYTQKKHDLSRVAIIDWDVHHGNGTQDIFYDDENVLFISIHQNGLFANPEYGAIGQIGTGLAEGKNINIPLPGGSGNATYLAVIQKIIKPILQQYSPDMIFVSSGVDASARDSLGRMNLSSEGFRLMTREIKSIADSVCDGKIVFVHEGGYSSSYSPYCALAIIEELAGEKEPYVEPFKDRFALAPTRKKVGLDADKCITDVIAVLESFWDL